MIGFDDSIDWFGTMTQSKRDNKKSLIESSVTKKSNFVDFTDPSINSLITYPEEVDELKITYYDDLDLKHIHTLIREKFIREIKKMSTCDSEIEKNTIRLQNNRIPDIDRSLIINEINTLINFKNNNDTILRWNRYKTKVEAILEEYYSLIESSTVNNNSTTDNFLVKRQELIESYLDSVSELGIIKIFSRKLSNMEAVCIGCLKLLQQDLSLEIGGFSTCSCGFNESSIKHLTEFTDVNRQITFVDSEQSVKQIKDWLDNVKCLHNNVYGKGQDNMRKQNELFEKFDKLCQKHNFPNRFAVLNKLVPQPPMSVVINLIKLCKKPELYNNKHQIRHDYYGYDIYDINENQEANVIKYYIDFQNVYETTKKRKTKVHIEILGCVLLIMFGVNVNPGDFKIPVSEETIAYSHNCIIEIFTLLGFSMDQIPNVLRIFT